MHDYIIDVNNLTKHFNRNTNFISLLGMVYKQKLIYAVKNVSFKVKKGEVFCLMGPNGAGKTTLLKILCGLIVASSGSVKLFGYDILKHADKIKSLIGISSFTENSFFGKLTAKQNLDFFSALYNIKPRHSESKINDIAKILGMVGHMDIMFQDLSAGMKQKLMIARSILNSFEILFLDEPTKSLDILTVSRLMEFLKKISMLENKTIFYITHNLEDAEIFSNRIAIMDKGEINIFESFRQAKDMLRVINNNIVTNDNCHAFW